MYRELIFSSIRCLPAALWTGEVRVILVSIASDRPPLPFVAGHGSRHRVSALGRIHSMAGRPMRYLEDGMSGFKQSEANAPRMRIVIAPSRAGSVEPPLREVGRRTFRV